MQMKVVRGQSLVKARRACLYRCRPFRARTETTVQLKQLEYYFFELNQAEQMELAFRSICFALIAIDLFFCFYNWSLGSRDVGFSLSMVLVYSLVKLFTTAVETALPD